MWTVRRDDEGWYSVENYIYGHKLFANLNSWNGRKIYPVDPPSVSYVAIGRNMNAFDNTTAQWRSIQINGRVCIVNRACDDFSLVADYQCVNYRPF